MTPQILVTQPTNVVVVEVDSTPLFIWLEAHGMKSQSVLHIASASDVAITAGPADDPEMAKADAVGTVVQTAYAIPQNPFD